MPMNEQSDFPPILHLRLKMRRASLLKGCIFVGILFFILQYGTLFFLPFCTQSSPSVHDSDQSNRISTFAQCIPCPKPFSCTITEISCVDGSVLQNEACIIVNESLFQASVRTLMIDLLDAQKFGYDCYSAAPETIDIHSLEEVVISMTKMSKAVVHKTVHQVWNGLLLERVIVADWSKVYRYLPDKHTETCPFINYRGISHHASSAKRKFEGFRHSQYGIPALIAFVCFLTMISYLALPENKTEQCMREIQELAKIQQTPFDENTIMRYLHASFELSPQDWAFIRQQFTKPQRMLPAATS